MCSVQIKLKAPSLLFFQFINSSEIVFISTFFLKVLLKKENFKNIKAHRFINRNRNLHMLQTVKYSCNANKVEIWVKFN